MPATETKNPRCRTTTPGDIQILARRAVRLRPACTSEDGFEGFSICCTRSYTTASMRRSRVFRPHRGGHPHDKQHNPVITGDAFRWTSYVNRIPRSRREDALMPDASSETISTRLPAPATRRILRRQCRFPAAHGLRSGRDGKFYLQEYPAACRPVISASSRVMMPPVHGSHSCRLGHLRVHNLRFRRHRPSGCVS
jgi:hypothetical protein